MAKKALSSILSKFKSEKRLQLVEDVSFKEPKTKLAKDYFDKLNLDSALIITSDADQNTMLAIRNLKSFSFLDATEINPYDLIKCGFIREQTYGIIVFIRNNKSPFKPHIYDQFQKFLRFWKGSILA